MTVSIYLKYLKFVSMWKTQTHSNTNTHTYVHTTSTHVYIVTHVQADTQMYIHTYPCTRVYTDTQIHKTNNRCTHICTNAHKYTHLLVHTYTQDQNLWWKLKHMCRSMHNLCTCFEGHWCTPVVYTHYIFSGCSSMYMCIHVRLKCRTQCSHFAFVWPCIFLPSNLIAWSCLSYTSGLMRVAQTQSLFNLDAGFIGL